MSEEIKQYLGQGREGVVTYMLRSCDENMSAYGGFTWPQSGAVECPDWNPRQECGNGLHGLLMGVGGAALTAQDDPTAKWLVCAVWSADVVDLGDKVKVPRAWVTFCGARDAAVAEIMRLGAVAPIYGTATAGDAGTATAGDGGTATAGYGGTATAGYAGTATAGDRGTATAGYAGTATAGYGGMICIKRWNGNRYRMVVGHIGEDGLLPNVSYRLDEDGSFIRAKPEPG